MATDRQIAANRANAKKSTGPKTAVGKIRSSRNAFRHGLSQPMPELAATLAKIEAIAHAVADDADNDPQTGAAFARFHVELVRIHDVRAPLLTDFSRDVWVVCEDCSRSTDMNVPFGPSCVGPSSQYQFQNLELPIATIAVGPG